MVYHLITQPSYGDYTAYMDYMDLAVSCPRKTVKLNHSPTPMWTSDDRKTQGQ